MIDKRKEFDKIKYKLKKEIGDKCFCCGEDGKYMHHIVPLSVGGTNYVKNIALLCQECHSRVHDSNFVKASKLSSDIIKEMASKEEFNCFPVVVYYKHKPIGTFKSVTSCGYYLDDIYRTKGGSDRNKRPKCFRKLHELSKTGKEETDGKFKGIMIKKIKKSEYISYKNKTSEIEVDIVENGIKEYSINT